MDGWMDGWMDGNGTHIHYTSIACTLLKKKSPPMPPHRWTQKVEEVERPKPSRFEDYENFRERQKRK